MTLGSAIDWSTTPWTDEQHFSEQAALYALEVLDADERDAFAAAITAHPQLADEVDALTATVSLIGAGAPAVAPPASLRADVLGAIADLPQLPPVIGRRSPARPEAVHPEVVHPKPVHPEAAGADTVRPVTSSIPLVASTSGAAIAPTAPIEDAPSRRWARPLVVVLSAAAAIALFFVGGVVVPQVFGGPGTSTTAEALTALTAAPDVQTTVAQTTDGASVTLLSSASLDRSAIVTDSLGALPSSSVYELWYIDESGATPAGLFDMGPDGATVAVLDGDFEPGVTVGITVEPAGGSEQPTTEPIWAVAT